MHRPKASTLKIKQLKKLKLEKKFKAVIRFIKKNIGKYYKTAAK